MGLVGGRDGHLVTDGDGGNLGVVQRWRPTDRGTLSHQAAPDLRCNLVEAQDPTREWSQQTVADDVQGHGQAARVTCVAMMRTAMGLTDGYGGNVEIVHA